MASEMADNLIMQYVREGMPSTEDAVFGKEKARLESELYATPKSLEIISSKKEDVDNKISKPAVAGQDKAQAKRY